MRESLAGLAWIERRVEGQSQWLVRWNGNWRRYALVGGHVEKDESFLAAKRDWNSKRSRVGACGHRCDDDGA